MGPGGTGGKPKAIGGIQEAKDVGSGLARVLKCKGAGELILAIDEFVPAGLQAVLMFDGDQRNLIVIAAATGKIGQWVKRQERQGLRADLALGDHEAWRDVALALRGGGHERRGGGVVAVPSPLITRQKNWDHS